MDVFTATKAGDLSAIRKLIRGGGSFNSRNRTGMTPLMFAVECAQPGVVRLLLDEGANINSKDILGQTALMIAAAKGRHGKWKATSTT